MNATIETKNVDSLEVSFTLETTVGHLRKLRDQLTDVAGHDIVAMPAELRLFVATLNRAVSRADVKLGVDIEREAGAIGWSKAFEGWLDELVKQAAAKEAAATSSETGS